MSNTFSSIHLFNERAAMVLASFEEKRYLNIREICTAIGRGISVARSLVQEMVAQGMLHIVTVGCFRFYFREKPAPSELPVNASVPREREEVSPMRFLRSPAERTGNTVFDECRRNSGMYRLMATIRNSGHAQHQMAA
ncbi:hypothetical protein CYR55_22615 [Chimaeribacter californicus]|uniref:Uncharacterized protein n=1 Tax=Chimaeribacter californicus TaxID=2060067 RepID=A0A2N5DTG5_9GAMM|nr:hypothetical protein [Chimaeribacter californicus]PLR29813.1 hypothetical protein CYR55_22615 [Chimaeribacter californicus]